MALMNFKRFLSRGSDDQYRYEYYTHVALLVNNCTEYYVDLFLLWLLYRFMKPQNTLQDGRTEASVLLFAQDSGEAQMTLLNWYT